MDCTHQEWFETPVEGSLFVDRRCCACNAELDPAPPSANPEGVASNKRNPTRITNALIEEICDLVREGVYPHIAAQSCGVSYNVWQSWQGREDDPYAELQRRVAIAHATARAGAETRVKMGDPFKWLIHGPGRDKGPGTPEGWTKQVRQEISGPGGKDLNTSFDFSGLSDDELRDLIRTLEKSSSGTDSE